MLRCIFCLNSSVTNYKHPTRYLMIKRNKKTTINVFYLFDISDTFVLISEMFLFESDYLFPGLQPASTNPNTRRDILPNQYNVPGESQY